MSTIQFLSARFCGLLLCALFCAGFTFVPTRAGATEIKLYEGPIEIPATDQDSGERAPARLYLPLQYQLAAGARWPLVILLHGLTGTADLTDIYFQMRFRVSLRGFILLTPEGTKTPNGVRGPKGEDLSGAQFWNATDACCDFGRTGVDDVSYLRELLHSVQDQYRVDPRRIYIIGHSNGGFMANRLACELGEELAGVVSLAGGSFRLESQCRRPTPLSFLQIHAVDDATVAYEHHERYAGAVDSVSQWRQRNHCEETERQGSDRDFLILKKGNDTSIRSWSQCDGGTQVEFWTIRNFDYPLHNPHIPLMLPAFTDDVLDFLFAHRSQTQSQSETKSGRP